MKLSGLIPATFIKRQNRFTAAIRLPDGQPSIAYLPTTGRLTGVLHPNCTVWLEPAANPKRKTPFTVLLAELPKGGLCAVKAVMANQLFEEALKQQTLAAFPYPVIEHEVTYGKSRLDFRLSGPEETCWVEVKSVTYARDGVGMFPDAPTARGRKHLDELAHLVQQGSRASVVFIALRQDACSFSPFKDIDPGFAKKLGEVQASGVEIHAYRCHITPQCIHISKEIPVQIN